MEINGIFDSQAQVYFTSKTKVYPDGTCTTYAANKPIFRVPGYENSGWDIKPVGDSDALSETEFHQQEETPTNEKSSDRARRRARTRVKDIARCNLDFCYFVTLTLDQTKIDRYDVAAITRKLNVWLDNHVRRNGLKYVIIPEYHKDKAIHFHGFFNDALEASDSGTIIPPTGGRPKKPRSKKQRDEWLRDGGHIVYNLPQWTLGYTSAIPLYGDRNAAIAYVCKYISKTEEKIGGRWYYSGGDLLSPICLYGNQTAGELASEEANVYATHIKEADIDLCIKDFHMSENGVYV